MIKSVIFDLGGILVPEAKAEIRSSVANFLGIKSHDLETRTNDLSLRTKIGELTLHDFYEITLSRFQISSITPQKAVDKHLEVYTQYSSAIDSQILELVEKLRSNEYLVASTTNTEQEIYNLSSRKGYFELFDHNFVSVEMRMAKPEYQFFGKMLDDLKLKPRETVFIDDSIECVQRACEVGINGIRYENFTKLGIDLKYLEVKCD